MSRHEQALLLGGSTSVGQETCGTYPSGATEARSLESAIAALMQLSHPAVAPE